MDPFSLHLGCFALPPLSFFQPPPAVFFLPLSTLPAISFPNRAPAMDAQPSPCSSLLGQQPRPWSTEPMCSAPFSTPWSASSAQQLLLSVSCTCAGAETPWPPSSIPPSWWLPPMDIVPPPRSCSKLPAPSLPWRWPLSHGRVPCDLHGRPCFLRRATAGSLSPLCAVAPWADLGEVHVHGDAAAPFLHCHGAPSLLVPAVARKRRNSRPLWFGWSSASPCYLLPDAPSRWHPTALTPSLLRLAATAARVPSVRQNVVGDVLLQHRRRSLVGCCFCAASNIDVVHPGETATLLVRFRIGVVFL
jgi:hypothetical protein